VAELFVQIAVSLDNFIEAEDGDLEWFTHDSSFDPIATATLRSIDGMIFGRKAHALLAGFWPTAQASPELPELGEQTELMNTLPKHVLTRGDEIAAWGNSHVLRADDIAALKARAQRPIALFAGAKAVQLALERDLVDELRLVRYPVLLGRGTPLFGGGDGRRRRLVLASSERFASGATFDRYRFEG
jgi:dihydrofolate reductase